MKYVAILETENELSEEVIKELKNTTFISDFPSIYHFKMTSIKQAPEKAHYDSFWANFHYNQALRDCKILE